LSSNGFNNAGTKGSVAAAATIPSNAHHKPLR
jgi:hypothetical protein